jgi:hypothetical protein
MLAKLLTVPLACATAEPGAAPPRTLPVTVTSTSGPKSTGLPHRTTPIATQRSSSCSSVMAKGHLDRQSALSEIFLMSTIYTKFKNQK